MAFFTMQIIMVWIAPGVPVSGSSRDAGETQEEGLIKTEPSPFSFFEGDAKKIELNPFSTEYFTTGEGRVQVLKLSREDQIALQRLRNHNRKRRIR
jgi:hypothetical protein